MTQEQREMLEQIILTGQFSKDVTIAAGLATITLKSLKVSDQMEVERSLKPVDSTVQFYTHNYAVKMAALALKEFKTKAGSIVFKSADDAEKFILSSSPAVADAIIKAHNNLEKEISGLSELKDLEQDFIPTPSQTSEQK